MDESGWRGGKDEDQRVHVVLVRLPCYDFTPVANSAVSGSLPKASFPISGEINSHGVTGGEYKTRERIHRSIADLRLLVIPAS